MFSPVELLHHELHRLFSRLFQFQVDEGPAGAHDVLDVESGSPAENSPDGFWEVEEQSLDKQHNGYPVIVGDLTAGLFHVFPWNVTVKGQVVSVSKPAVVVGIVALVAGEVSRNPALDRISDELLCGDDDGEDAEENATVWEAEAIG